MAGMPVMKSSVMKVRTTTERWQDGTTGRCWGSRSKCTGINTTGIWLMEFMTPGKRVGGACNAGGVVNGWGLTHHGWQGQCVQCRLLAGVWPGRPL